MTRTGTRAEWPAGAGGTRRRRWRGTDTDWPDKIHSCQDREDRERERRRKRVGERKRGKKESKTKTGIKQYYIYI